VPGIVSAFNDPQLPIYAFAAKLIFYRGDAGVGYLGGKVTPLFFIACGVGQRDGYEMLGVAGRNGRRHRMAANSPVALSIMVMELLGAPIFPTSYSWRPRIFAVGASQHLSSQRVIHSKSGARSKKPTFLARPMSENTEKGQQ